MKWDDNLLLEGDAPGIAIRGQFQFAMFALHLSTGHSIQCKSLKSSTIEQYVLNAATLVALFT